MATTTGERVFLRKASGLIKTASNTDVLIFDIGLVSIGLGLAFLLYFGPAAYPGSNLYLATLIAGLAMLFVGGGMICWTVTISVAALACTYAPCVTCDTPIRPVIGDSTLV